MSIPDFKSPSKTSDKTATQQTNNNASTLIYVLIGIIVCLLLIVLAMLLSPSPDVEQKINNNSQTSQTKKNSIVNSKKKNQQETINEQSGGLDWMVKKTEAENDNLSVWASESYEQALLLAQQAGQLKKEKKYSESEENFQMAINELERSFANKQNIYTQLKAQADGLFSEEKLIEAKKYYTKIQAIEPDNRDIKHQLSRISGRAKVDELYQTSIEKEKNQKITEALDLIKQALKIEPEYEKIKIRLAELENRKKEIIFKEMISQTLEALENKDLTLAKSKLSVADKIKPEDAIVLEMKNRVIEITKQNSILRLKKQAKKQEKLELWQDAVKTYKKILAIDPLESSTIVNKRRADLYQHLNELLNVIIKKPQRLQNDKVLKKSGRTLKFVHSELSNKHEILFSREKTPNLNKKIIAAETIIKDASKKITIKIISDNETNVMLYKVAKFGKLLEKNIELRPGKYTIVGSRAGYRDYRKVFSVSASDKILEILVQCREKI